MSAYHGRGTADLLDRIISLLPAQAPSEAETAAMKVAIVGRPNVGKSLLLNTLVGSRGPLSMTSRAPPAMPWIPCLTLTGKMCYLLIQPVSGGGGRVAAGVERYSVIRTLRAIDRADVVLLVLDATEMVTAQDTHVAGYIQQAAKGIILVVNKWDLVENKDRTEWQKFIKGQLKFVTYAPVLYASAKTGQGVDKIMPQALEIYEERLKRWPTARVNDVIQQAVAAHNRPQSQGRQLKVFYATQAEVNPPTFVVFANDVKLIHFSYRRYLENKLRQAFGFNGTPLRLIFKTRGEA